MKRKWDQRKMDARAAYIDGSRAVAEYIRNSYADARAKRIARELGVSVAQAERYIAAKSLPSWVLFAMAKTHGWGFVEEIFEPLCGPREQDKLAEQVQAHLEANKEFIREALREAVGAGNGHPPATNRSRSQLGHELASDGGSGAREVGKEVARKRAGGAG